MVTITAGAVVIALFLIFDDSKVFPKNRPLTAREVRMMNIKFILKICLGVLLALLLANIWKERGYPQSGLFITAGLLIIGGLTVIFSPISRKPGYTQLVDNLLGAAVCEGLFLLAVGIFWGSVWGLANSIYLLVPGIP